MHFENAVKLSPNEAMAHAQLAYAYYQLNPAAARESATEALRLDALCPHEERKLAHRRLFSDVFLAQPTDIAYPGADSAEQWMLQIRNNADRNSPRSTD